MLSLSVLIPGYFCTVALIISAWDGSDGHYRKVMSLSVAFFCGLVTFLPMIEKLATSCLPLAATVLTFCALLLRTSGCAPVAYYPGVLVKCTRE